MDGAEEGETKAIMKLRPGRPEAIGLAEVAGLLGLDEEDLVKKVPLSYLPIHPQPSYEEGWIDVV